MNAPASAIHLSPGDGRVRVRYERPDLGRLLADKPVDQALALIPTLLPVCGHAQHIAARRAVEAAREQEETGPQRLERENALLVEQAQAAAWRLLVDWPRAIGETPDLPRLKTLRSARGTALADGLEGLLPPCLHRAPETVGPEFVKQFADGRSRDSVSATTRCLWTALHAVTLKAASVETLSGHALWERARSFLGSPLLTGNALGQTADVDALTVGPLAMDRHPAMQGLKAMTALAPIPRLLAAALLDTHFLVHALRDAITATPADLPQRVTAPGVGVGYALTARGPLHHMVALDDAGQVKHWRYLAPTDWHFASGGLVDRLARHTDEEQLPLLVLAADPCAPWSIARPDRQEAA